MSTESPDDRTRVQAGDLQLQRIPLGASAETEVFLEEQNLRVLQIWIARREAAIDEFQNQVVELEAARKVCEERLAHAKGRVSAAQLFTQRN